MFIALVAALLYVSFPAYSKAVYWPSAPDTIATLFCLGAVWFWLVYLQLGNSRNALFSFLSFLFALLTKETSMMLPAILFLFDRLVIYRPATFSVLLRRYLLFVLAWIPYLLMEYLLQRSGSYVSLAGYGWGLHMVENLISSLATLVFPWQSETTFRYFWVAGVSVLFILAMLKTQNTSLLFLGMVLVLNLIPVIGFPPQWFEMRYLYTVAISATILFAVALDWIWQKLYRPRWYTYLTAWMVTLILFVNGISIAEAITDWGEIARQRAVPFRDIARLHPSFPSQTKLYFIDSRTTSVYDLSVMFLLRYGAGVIIDGTDDNQPHRVARLRETPVSYVYYFDHTGKPIEVQVAQITTTSTMPPLPVTWSAPVQLEGFEVTSTTLKRGDALVLFLYWRAIQRIDEDYDVFVNLISASGEIVVSHSGAPRGGRFPTSDWEPNRLIVDSVVLLIPQYPSLGTDYHLEVGLYSSANGERLSILGADRSKITDHVVISTFELIE